MFVANQKDFDTSTQAINADFRRQNTMRKTPDCELKAKQILFREGDEVHKIYEVKSGVVRLTKVFEDGRRQVLAFGFPGDIIGFPQNGMYHAECDAISPAVLIIHSVKDLESGYRNPELHLRLVKAALKEIGSMQDHFMMLGRKTASEKTASFIFGLLERAGTSVGKQTQVDFPMTRADIADFLGLTIETVSRTIGKFKSLNLIALDSPKSVTILDPDALYDMAEFA